MLGYVCRYKTTISLLLLIVIVAFMSGTENAHVTKYMRREYGFAAKSIIEGDIFKIISSALLTHGKWYFVRACFMVTLCVGLLERQKGSGVAFRIFWGSHIFTLFLFGIISLIGAFFLNLDFFINSFRLADVGPSAGYFGCIGALIASLSKRRLAFLLGALCIIGLIMCYHLYFEYRTLDIIADIAHFIALLIGFGIGSFFKKTSLNLGK